MTNLLPKKIVSDYIESLEVSKAAPIRSLWVISALYVLPVLSAGVVFLFGKVDLDIAALLGSVAVFTGLLFNLAFLIFDRSISMRKDPLIWADEKAIILVDKLYSNTIYAVLIGLICTAAMACSIFFEIPKSAVIFERIFNAFIAFLLVHLFTISCAILRDYRALRLAIL